MCEIFLTFSLTSLTSMLVAPASSEFSMSSLTTELTEVITCELAINRTVDEGSRFIAHGTEDVYLGKIRVFLRRGSSQKRICRFNRPPYLFCAGNREEHVINHRPTTSKRKLTTSCGVERTFSPGAII